MAIYEIVDMEHNTIIYYDWYDKTTKVATTISYNKYYDCNTTMTQLVNIFVKDIKYKNIHIKKIYTI